MFDIGFSELLLVFVIGLIVLGPQRLPAAVKTLAGWIRTLRSLAANVQNELAQELKLQELQDSLNHVGDVGKTILPSELKASVDELRQATEVYLKEDEKAHDEQHVAQHPAGGEKAVFNARGQATESAGAVNAGNQAQVMPPVTSDKPVSGADSVAQRHEATHIACASKHNEQ